MKAIPTHYLGYYFRSRLEARWAVFLETLQLHWRFEVQGYELPTGRYLPDFFLRLHDSALSDHQPPGSGYWVEIKPDGDPSDRELALLAELAWETGHNAYLVAGSPWPGKFRVWKACRDYGDGRQMEARELPGPNVYGGMPTVWLLCDRSHDMGFSVDPADGYRRARSARFEHGEEPGMPLGWEGVEVVTGEPLEVEPISSMWGDYPDRPDDGSDEADAA